MIGIYFFGLLLKFSFRFFKIEDEEILNLKNELEAFRKRTCSKASFSASLCCFESIDTKNGVEFDENNVQFVAFINTSLASFNAVLANISRKKIPSFDSSLSKMFRPYLDGKSSVCMLYHVSNASIKKGLENIKHVVPANKDQPSNGAKRKVLENITNFNSKRVNFLRN